MASVSSAHLKRDIGYFGAMLLVLNGLIGAGIFALPGAVGSSPALQPTASRTASATPHRIG